MPIEESPDSAPVTQVAAVDGDRNEMVNPAGLGKRERLARWLTGNGIEVGALHHPLAVPASAEVTYVDRLSEAELRVHYPELAKETFAPVGVIGDAQNLSAFADGSLDFVIANHLLEHLEDPIQGLIEFHRVLKQDGVLYLALPDPRMTFDKDRPLTDLEHLLVEHRAGTAATRRAHYLEWAGNVDKVVDPTAHAARLDAMDYSIHFHVWLPDGFLRFLFAAEAQAGLVFELAAYAPPETADDNEYILILLKGASPRLRLPTRAIATARHPEAHGWARLRSAVRASPAGPILAPVYRRLRRR